MFWIFDLRTNVSVNQVCNHPELFERREIRSPYYMKLNDYVVPKLLYREGKLLLYQSPEMVL